MIGLSVIFLTDYWCGRNQPTVCNAIPEQEVLVKANWGSHRRGALKWYSSMSSVSIPVFRLLLESLSQLLLMMGCDIKTDTKPPFLPWLVFGRSVYHNWNKIRTILFTSILLRIFLKLMFINELLSNFVSLWCLSLGLMSWEEIIASISWNSLEG